MRLFTAIELDAATRERLAREQRRIASVLGRQAAALRFVRPELLHMTVVFLGERDDHAVAAIRQALVAALPVPRFTVGFGGLATFPTRGRPQVLWLGLTHGADESVALHTEVEARLTCVGVVPEARPFHPHLTLARWRNGRSHPRRALDEVRDVRHPRRVETVATMVVEAVTLFRSDLASQGPAHTVMQQTPLARRGCE